MGKEDFLLQQIDEFRDKAQKLQGLLATKENKVQELQSIVKERENKAKELDSIVVAKKEEAGKITDEVERQVQQALDGLTEKMDAIAAQLKEEQGEHTKRLAKQAAQFAAKVESLQPFLDELKPAVKEIKPAVEELKPEITEVITPAIKNVESRLLEHQEAFEQIKMDIMDKTHSENVKCYRNVQVLVEELEEKIDNIDMGESHLKGLKGGIVAVVVLTIINIAVAALTFAQSAGLLPF